MAVLCQECGQLLLKALLIGVSVKHLLILNVFTPSALFCHLSGHALFRQSHIDCLVGQMVGQVFVVLVATPRPRIMNTIWLRIHLNGVPLSIILRLDVNKWVMGVLAHDRVIVFIAAIVFNHVWVLDKSILDNFWIPGHSKNALVLIWHFQTKFPDLIESASLALGDDTHFNPPVDIPIQKKKERSELVSNR